MHDAGLSEDFELSWPDLLKHRGSLNKFVISSKRVIYFHTRISNIFEDIHMSEIYEF